MTVLLPQPRIMRAVPCSCVESETPGLTEDLNWWSSNPESLTRTLGNGLLECGFCDGDQWLWDETEERAFTLGELNTEGTRSYVQGVDEGMEAERTRCLNIVLGQRKLNDPDLASNTWTRRAVFTAEGAALVCDVIAAAIEDHDV